MTAFDTLLTSLKNRAAYIRTKREIRNLPLDLAVEDLGVYPGDAKRIARHAVYG